jgi:2-aminoadipate transaminase
MTSFARRAERVQPSAIREFLALAGQPGITSFAGGYPDPTLFPMRELHGIYDALLTDGNASALQYTASEGLPELRALVAARLSADGMPCTADDVLITQGWAAGSGPHRQALRGCRRRHRHGAAHLPRGADRLQPV